MKHIAFLIDKCSDCPYLTQLPHDYPRCKKTKKIVIPNAIHQDCPLGDYKLLSSYSGDISQKVSS